MWYILVSYHLHGRFVATHLLNFPPDLTSFYSISDMAKFCAKESSKQKESKISKTDQKSITKTGVRPLYLSPILHWFYPVRYIVSFWCSITLIEGDFKNTKKLTKISGGNRWSDYSCLNVNSQLIYPIRYMASFWRGNTFLKRDFKNTKTYQNMQGQEVVRPLLILPWKI